MGKPAKVAVKGDIQAVASLRKHPSNVGPNGYWEAEKPTEQLGSKITVNGVPVLIEASATFKYIIG